MPPSTSFSARFALLLTCLTSLVHFTLAQVPASSTFVHGGGLQNLSVSINVPDNSTDSLYFHFNGPATSSWVGFGFGQGMTDALIFVAYASQGRKSVTLSPRLGIGHVMPEYTSNVKVTMLPGSGIVNNVFSVNAMCTGCRSWGSSSLDIKSTSQPMIWAIGPAWSLASDDMDAPIRQHQIYDHFSMNLAQATGTAGLPGIGSAGSTSNSTTGSSGAGEGPPGWNAPPKVVAHALLMIGSFLILFPLGYLCLRIFEKVWLHSAIQTVGTLIVIISAALGISVSKGSKISPNLTNPHQILGLLILALVIGTYAIGLSGHIVFQRTGAPAKFMIGHRVLGPLTVSLGLINVCVGFHFASNNRPIIVFVILTLLMIIFVSGVVLFVRRRKMRRNAMNTPAAMNFREAHGQAVPTGAGAKGPTATVAEERGPAIPLQTYQQGQQPIYR